MVALSRFGLTKPCKMGNVTWQTWYSRKILLVPLLDDGAQRLKALVALNNSASISTQKWEDVTWNIAPYLTETLFVPVLDADANDGAHWWRLIHARPGPRRRPEAVRASVLAANPDDPGRHQKMALEILELYRANNHRKANAGPIPS